MLKGTMKVLTDESIKKKYGRLTTECSIEKVLPTLATVFWSSPIKRADTTAT